MPTRKKYQLNARTMNPDIDEKMKEIVKVLNGKGYKTVSSCEGHASERFFDLYVAFDHVILSDRMIPEGDLWFGLVERKEDGRVTYSVHLGSYVMEKPRKVSEKYLEGMRKELLEWAMSLPKREAEK